MIPMKCLKSLTYAGRRLTAGDKFDAKGESDARVLVAIKKAERVKAVNIAPIFAPAVVTQRQRAVRAEVVPAKSIPEQPAVVVELPTEPVVEVEVTENADVVAAELPIAEEAHADKPVASKPTKNQYSRRNMTAGK